MEKFKIEMTKDEMIRYYANKIVEDGIKDCSEFSNIIDINNYGNIGKYKKEILERIYRDERVADVDLDKEGNFDMVFYTDFCPYYYDKEILSDSYYDTDSEIKKDILRGVIDYYYKNCLWDNPYITTRDLFNRFAESQSLIGERREEIVNTLKKALNENHFVENNIEGIEVYITPKNYKELEQAIEETIQSIEQEELE